MTIIGGKWSLLSKNYVRVMLEFLVLDFEGIVTFPINIKLIQVKRL